MAIKKAIASMAALMIVLCGCGNPFLLNEIEVEESDSTEAAAGSAQMQDSQTAGSSDFVNETQPIMVEGVVETQQEERDQLESQKEAAQKPLSGYVICLDPGHGITSKTGTEQVSPISSEQKDAYASGGESARQTEEELCLAVSEKVRDLLEERGASVVMTREKHHSDIGLIARAQIANEADADLCIRIHADDSDEGSSANGISTLIPAGELLGTPEIAQPSREAAEYIQRSLVEKTGAYDRGLVERSDLTGFNWSEVPNVLVEMGFLSNPQEDELLATDEYRQKIAEGIVEGAQQWLAAQSE